jgi:quercetin dioxygenase-like cupin family protein
MRPAQAFPVSNKPVLNVLGQMGVNLITHAESNGKLALCQFHIPRAGMGVPAHVHQREDEFFHVLKGRIKVNVGGIETVLGAGQSAIGPRDVVHAWEALEDDSQLLVAATPAGLDEMFVELSRVSLEGQDMTNVITVCRRFGIEFV